MTKTTDKSTVNGVFSVGTAHSTIRASKMTVSRKTVFTGAKP
jgi:hypothetical protein